ncbi:WD repeat-containing protein 91-like protein [Smittium mucronatum]|uniref:WD repeat-containing protein 91-like protein n=1 Tax=Smittium mucronatum TaxID=133383 RepID=A0A1R0H8W0_9FUNG|nr:WD repeat-containing protein 91-like protein [Smittium mucronatum]
MITLAFSKNKLDIISSFFNTYGAELSKEADWIPWLAITYIPDPQKKPEYEAAFTQDWVDALKLSLTDFIDSLFKSIETPRILKFESDRIEIMNLHTDIDVLKTEIISLKSEISNLNSTSVKSTSFIPLSLNSTHLDEDNSLVSANKELNRGSFIQMNSLQDSSVSAQSHSISPRTENPLNLILNSNQFNHPQDSPPLILKKQSLFMEHSSAIIFSQFSPDGSKIASVDEDNLLKIWSHLGDDSILIVREFEDIICGMTWNQFHSHLLYLYFDTGGFFAFDSHNKVLHHHFDLPNPDKNTVTMGSGIVAIYDFTSDSPIFSVNTISKSNNEIGKKSTSFSGDKTIGGTFSFDENSFFTITLFGKLQQWCINKKETSLISESLLGLTNLTSKSPPELSNSFKTESSFIFKNNSVFESLVNSESYKAKDTTPPPQTTFKNSHILAKFSYDSDFLVLAIENTAHVFDVSLGSLVFSLKPMAERITDIDFDSTGRYVLSACEDGTIRVGTVIKQ